MVRDLFLDRTPSLPRPCLGSLCDVTFPRFAHQAFLRMSQVCGASVTMVPTHGAVRLGCSAWRIAVAITPSDLKLRDLDFLCLIVLLIICARQQQAHTRESDI